MLPKTIWIIAALGIGWILAGEPTSLDELRSGIDRIIGRGGGGGMMRGGYPIGPNGLPSLNFDHRHHHGHHHDNGGGMGGGGGGMPFPMPGQPPGGSDPNTQNQLTQMQQQMQQQQQQSQMQQQQQQFQDQLQQQSQQASMAQMQQQLQQAQQQAAAGAAGATAAGQQPATTAPPPATSAATTATTPSPPDAAQTAQTAQSQQMTPSAVAPGVIPQTPGTDPTQAALAAGNPYAMQYAQQNPYAIQQSPYGQPTSPYGAPVSPYGAPSPPPVSPYGGTLGVPVGYGQPLGGTPMQNMFASSPNVLGGYQNINVRGPASYTNHVSNVHQPVQTSHNNNSHGGQTYRSHLGIVDGDQDPKARRPFFQTEQELLNIDLGNIYPGLDGIKVIDLILSSPSQNADEVFPRGVDKFSYGSFEEAIHVYITRILRHMEGFSPPEKVGILRDVLQTYAQTHPYNVQTSPSPFTLNPLSHKPHKGPLIRSGLPIAADGMVYQTDQGFMLPNKYATLQITGTNSMPPLIHFRTGSPKNKKTLFFNGQ